MLIVLIVLYIIGAITENSSPGNNDTAAKPETTVQAEAIDPVDTVLTADYNEGYKAGYDDGRVKAAALGDIWLPPAKTEYSRGYVAGLVVGCRESGLDCTAIENAIE